MKLKTMVFLCVTSVLMGVGLAICFLRIQRLEAKVGDTSLQNTNSDINIQDQPQTYTNEVNNECGVECKELIAKEVSSALSTMIPTPISTPLPTTTATTNTSKQITYISLVGPISTTSTDWVDVPGSEVVIDIINDYGKSAVVTWEASLKIANANGVVTARLYDTTHSIAVNGSEITTTSASYNTVLSGNLSMWAGKNTYKVQIKSQTSQEATFGSGRIKVTY